jgi:hypothetical protein
MLAVDANQVYFIPHTGDETIRATVSNVFNAAWLSQFKT